MGEREPLTAGQRELVAMVARFVEAPINQFNKGEREKIDELVAIGRLRYGRRGSRVTVLLGEP